MKEKILIIEDDFTIQTQLKTLLSGNGYEVFAVTDFSQTIEQLKEAAPHLVILDIKLPGNNGFEICSQIRTFSDIPIVFVTSSNTDMDELNSIMLGGDAFITKPYNPAILLAKIAALLKKAYRSPQTEIYMWREATLHLESSMIEYKGQKAELTKNELKILYYLFKNSGKICSRNDIVDFLWDNQLYVDDNALSVNITRIRDKLAAIGLVDFIKTKHRQDYEVFYSDTNCVVEFLKETTGKLTVKYDAVDASQVTKSDIIGGYSVSTHKTTGLELINNVFPLYTKVPDLILCPNWSHDAEVAAVMSAKAENINGLFEGEAILDIDCTAETGATYYTEVPAWKKQKNFTKRTEVVCFPKVALGDRVFNLSTQLAASMSAVDNAEEYGGGTPCESASNKGIQADRMVTADGSEVVMDIQQANYLNENGVVTALNFFNGFVSWGNYTACYPANTDVTDYFYCINRMFKWVAKTLILTYWNYIDRGIKRRLIDAVVQSINDWLASLATDEKIIGGRVEFNESENSTSQLAAGIVRFHIYMTPPSPMQKMDFVLEYDLSYLAALVAA